MTTKREKREPEQTVLWALNPPLSLFSEKKVSRAKGAAARTIPKNPTRFFYSSRIRMPSRYRRGLRGDFIAKNPPPLIVQAPFKEDRNPRVDDDITPKLSRKNFRTFFLCSPGKNLLRSRLGMGDGGGERFLAFPLLRTSEIQLRVMSPREEGGRGEVQVGSTFH